MWSSRRRSRRFVGRKERAGGGKQLAVMAPMLDHERPHPATRTRRLRASSPSHLLIGFSSATNIDGAFDDRQGRTTGSFPPGGLAPRGRPVGSSTWYDCAVHRVRPSRRVGLERSTPSLGWWWILRPPLLNPPDLGMRSAGPRNPLRIGNPPYGCRTADGRRVRSHLPTSSSNCLESKRT
jgi:hypothetical protein